MYVYIYIYLYIQINDMVAIIVFFRWDRSLLLLCKFIYLEYVNLFVFSFVLNFLYLVSF